MRRVTLFLAMTLLAAACSGSDGTGADTTENGTAGETTTTTTVAETTTTAPPDTTTTTTTTTTTAPPDTTTTIAADLSFDTLAGTPPDAFDSFNADMTIAMTMAELAIEVSAVGTWTEDAFSCTVSSGMGGITFTESVIATPQELWHDQGSGYEPSSLFGTSAQDIMNSCPASPLFWASFAAEDFAGVSGDEELIGGRPAFRADLSDLAGTLGGLGLVPEFDGADIKELIMWIDVETATILAMVADVELSEELIGDLAGAETGPVGMRMDFSISNVNDPSLSVEVPRGSSS